MTSILIVCLQALWTQHGESEWTGELHDRSGCIFYQITIVYCYQQMMNLIDKVYQILLILIVAYARKATYQLCWGLARFKIKWASEPNCLVVEGQQNVKLFKVQGTKLPVKRLACFNPKCIQYFRKANWALCFMFLCVIDLTWRLSNCSPVSANFYVTHWVDKTQQEAGSWAVSWAVVASNTPRWCYFFNVFVFDCWYFSGLSCSKKCHSTLWSVESHMSSGF